MALQGFVLVSLLFINRIAASSFTFVNKCGYTVWPGILGNAGAQTLSTTGFELATGQTATLAAPAGWSGRMWGRTGCAFDSQGKGTCATGDCGGSLQCNGMGAAPPATLAEFTLGQQQQQPAASASSVEDFYDVSLVDGYNLPMLVTPEGGSGGNCSATGCIADLNLTCPKELQVADGSMACKSACDAFGTPEYCCSGAYGNPRTCQPSKYSRLFKTVCPRSYTYAYDDATSTFTCTGADYTITFCPPVSRRKSSTEGPTVDNDDTWGISAAAGDSATGGGVRRAEFRGWGILCRSGVAIWLFLTTWQQIFCPVSWLF